MTELSLPLGRLDECPACEVQVHVCRMCVHFAPQVAKQCREDDAEEVREKARANFCDYFQPSAAAHDPGFAAGDSQARSQLAGLFGETKQDEAPEEGADDPGSAADDLFK
ncbi:MAG: hypothetical protein ACR2QB_10045 [Gammaproteobacteria bacterium]